jgi:hypothetical protein
MDRRQFLKLGAVSSAALTAVGVTATLTGCSEPLPQDNDAQWKALRPSDRVFLTAIAPVMLKGALPVEAPARQQAIDSILANTDAGIFNLGPHNTKQMKELFDLLNFGLSRGLTTGVWSSWDKASEQEIENFLNRWRESSLSLFNLAYNGLNKLMCATWYGQTAAWQQVGYPGPLYPDALITKPSNS